MTAEPLLGWTPVKTATALARTNHGENKLYRDNGSYYSIVGLEWKDNGKYYSISEYQTSRMTPRTLLIYSCLAMMAFWLTNALQEFQYYPVGDLEYT